VSESLGVRVWLAAREPHAPPPLRDRMDSSLAAFDGDTSSMPHILAEAGLACLKEALQLGPARPAAFPLLAADALLTHACEAAAEAGPDALAKLCAALDLRRFAELLPGQA
jgi:hypothetical protein